MLILKITYIQDSLYLVIGAFIRFLFVKAAIVIKKFNLSKLWNRWFKYLQGSEYSEDANRDDCPGMQSM